MKINWKYIAFIVLLFIVYFAFQATMPKYFNWTISFYHLDKNPYGGKIFYELLRSRFDSVSINFNTVYEKEGQIDGNIIILAQNYFPDADDLEVLLNETGKGKKVLIAAQYFHYDFKDTLGLNVRFPFGEFEIPGQTQTMVDSTVIRLVNNNLDSSTTFSFPKQIGQTSFSRIDTLKASILAVDENEYPVLVSYPIGKGELFICSTPLVFTNYSLLLNGNYHLVEKILSYFNSPSIHWFQYYQMGRMESPSPMRYLLGEAPLKWAFYATMLAIFLFMIFEAKREQRIVPVIEPLKNHTLDFTRVIGRLYYQKKDHRDLAWKKIIYFHEYALAHYFIDIFKEDENLAALLAQKTGETEDAAGKLLNMIGHVRHSTRISSEYLFELNKLIDKFYSTDLK